MNNFYLTPIKRGPNIYAQASIKQGEPFDYMRLPYLSTTNILPNKLALGLLLSATF